MTISVLGLGLMGRAFAERLQAEGFSVAGWNRSEESVREAIARGLDASTDLADVAGADELVLALSDAAAIASTLFDRRVLHLAGKTVLQMGTIGPDDSREIAGRVARAGGHYLEAPVLGSIPEARAGTLLIMAGGSPADFEHCLPLLRALGSNPRLVGPVGRGAALKLAMNQLIAGLTTAFSASLGLIQAADVDVELFMELLRGSALYAPTFDKKLERMLGHEYGNPNFPLKHLLKDTRLFAATARAGHQDTGVAEALVALLEKGVDAGFGDDDYSALHEAVNASG